MAVDIECFVIVMNAKAVSFKENKMAKKKAKKKVAKKKAKKKATKKKTKKKK